MRNNAITKTFQITASPEVMRRFERFLCFFHYNGGHSGMFAMPFDGDGADYLKVEPPPIRENGDHHKVASFGPEVEIAYNNCYKTFSLARDKTSYKVQNGVKTKILPDGTETIIGE